MLASKSPYFSLWHLKVVLLLPWFVDEVNERMDLNMVEEDGRFTVRSLSSSAPRWQTPSSRTPACSPGTAGPPGCLPGCWGSARPGETLGRENVSQTQ